MKISLAWLTDLFPAAAAHSPAEIGRLLTAAGLEVEGLETVERVPGGLRGVVLGTVLTCDRHPDADKLSVTTVQLGPAETDVKPIVCGAPNVAAGQRVVVATVGAELHPTGSSGAESKPLVIGKSKIRGQVSEGMICAEDELGLGSSHAGILVLDTDLPDGTPAAQYFGVEADTVLEIGLTPNRADAASHWGVARDLRALLPGTELPLPETAPLLHQVIGPGAQQFVPVRVDDPVACPRYAGLSVRGVAVAPSPEWLQRRLRAIGVGPINNVVDVTNYVLHELGQPLHAFDADRIQGGELIVRRAEAATPFTTLDGVVRNLHPEDLVIADAAGPLVLAGVFGGARAAVSAQTTNVFLEAAYFDPSTIRRASQRHGLKTDSSFRNERGTDPNMVLTALARAAHLLTEVTGGTVAPDFQDHYPAPIGPHVVTFKLERATRLIGQDLGEARVRELLAGLEIRIASDAPDGPAAPAGAWVLHVPPYRVDVQREADVVEDLLRLHGLDNIALPAHAAAPFISPTPRPDPDRLRRTLSETLVGRGYHEIVTSSLTWSGHYEAASGERADLVRLANANSAELNVLRPTLVPTVLDVLRRNLNRRQRDLKLYEFGRTYQLKASGKTDERETLLLVLTGQREAESWARKSEKASFHDLAGTVGAVLTRLGIVELLQQPLPAGHAYLTGGLTLHRQAGAPPVATVGVLDARQAATFDVEQPVYWAELDWAALVKAAQPRITVRELPRFPEVRRDLSLVVDRAVSFAEIATVARRTERKLLTGLNVFDVYEGDRLEAGKKAVAVAFTLQDPEQTLTDKVIDGTMGRLLQQLEKQLGATIRR